MLSIRLPREQEQQLDYVAGTTGLSKNSIVAKALNEHLARAELSSIPLAEIIREQAYDLSVRNSAQREEHYKNAHTVADAIARQAIFTKRDTPETLAGDATPGCYGRNIIVGYNNEAHDGEILVISRNISSHSPYGQGTSGYHLYITKYSDWEKYMVEIPVRRD